MAFTFKGNIQSNESDHEVAPSAKYTYKGNIQEEGDNLAVQYGLGLAKNITYPADIAKLATRGASEEILREMQSENPDEMLNPEIAREAQNKALEYFPTQELAEKQFENVTGISLQPKSTSGKIARSAGELTSPQGLTKEGLKQAARKLAAPVVGAGAEKGLEAIGVPEPIAGLAGIATTAIGEKGKVIPKGKVSIQPEHMKFSEYRFLEKEGEPLFKGVVSGKRAEKIEKELQKGTEHAVNEILNEALPIKKIRDKGISLEHAGSEAYSKATKLAEKIPEGIHIDPVMDYLDKEIQRVANIAPSLSEESKKYLSVLQDEYNALIGKTFSGKDIVNQHKEFNRNVSKMYEKDRFSGIEDDIRKLYAGMNDRLVQSAENAGHKAFSKEFREANSLWHNKAKLEEIETKLSEYLGENFNPEKLDKFLHDPKKSEKFERLLGEKGFDQVKEISKFSSKAKEKMNTFLKTKKNTVEELIKDWGPSSGVGLALGAIFGGLGFKVSGTYKLAKESIPRFYGWILTSEEGRNNYLNLLKSISSGSDKAIRRSASLLNQAYEDQFGKEMED